MLMSTKCLLLEETGQKLYYTDRILTPEDGQVLVCLKAASLNHRDLWIIEGKYPNIKLPCILGSDGCGVYEGKEIVVLPGNNWGNNPNFQSKEYKILGMPGNGTFAQGIFVFPEQIYKKPKHLSTIEAASVPLSGLTAWRALVTKGDPKPGENILISGIGGGVAMFVFQFALALGLNVFVTSGHSDKINKAIAMGAMGGVNYNDLHLAKNLRSMSGGFDIVIDSAGGDNFSQLLTACKPGARMVMYGGSLGNISSISPQTLFWKQITISGSTMGTPNEFQEMLDFMDTHQITPNIDSVFTLEQGNEAIHRMKSGAQFGKIVLTINTD